MKYRVYVIALILFLTVTVLYGGEKKIRAAGTGGIVLNNDLLVQSLSAAAAGTGGIGLALTYPVSSIERAVNVELSIANWYNIFPFSGDYLHTLRFGFGVRVFLNILNSVRPYFTHDITSALLLSPKRSGSARTFGILLGLGIDIPVGKAPRAGQERESGGRGRREASSFFFDVSWNTFTLRAFDPVREETTFLSLSCGYSLLLPSGDH